jgi:hypothetical protein
LLPVVLLLLLGETVLCLRDLELPVALEGDEADSEIGSAEIEGEVIADFFAGRPLRGVSAVSEWRLEVSVSVRSGDTYAEDESGD